MSIRDQIEQHGPAARDALEGLAREYGDDVLFWAIDQIKARRKRKRRRVRDEAIDDVREAAEARLRRDQGDGQQ